jgi:hypothetical protein
MGQQMMIIALLSSFLLSAGVLGMMGVWQDSTDIAASRFEEEQAINIASTGVNMGISRLRQNKNWRSGYSNVSISDGGTVSVRLTNIGLDSVRVTSVASFNNTNHTTIAEVELSSIFPTVESALTIYGDSVNFTNAGKSFNIDGRDYNPDGSKGAADDVHGIGVANTKIQAELKKQLVDGSISPNVIGKGGTGSVGTTVTTKTDLLELRTFYKSLATLTLAPGAYSGNAVYGTLDYPEIVYVPGDLEWSGTVSGAGILVVDGALLLAGKVSWQGIIIAVSGEVELELGSSGTPSLIGTTLIGSSKSNITNVHVNGNPQIKYSHLAIETVLQKLNLLNVAILSYYE